MTERLSKWNRLSGKFSFNARDWRFELDGLEHAVDELDLITRRLLRQAQRGTPKRRPPVREERQSPVWQRTAGD